MSNPAVDDIDEDPIRRHAQEPAEGDVEPGEVTASMPHAEEAAEGEPEAADS